MLDCLLCRLPDGFGRLAGAGVGWFGGSGGACCAVACGIAGVEVGIGWVCSRMGYAVDIS